MKRHAFSRFISPLSRSTTCSSCRCRLSRPNSPTALLRPFTTTARSHNANDFFATYDKTRGTANNTRNPPQYRPSPLSEQASFPRAGTRAGTPSARPPKHETKFDDKMAQLLDSLAHAPLPEKSSAATHPYLPGTLTAPSAPHHLHVFSTKHNTHITLTKPSRDPLISVSCGNIGFRKAKRGEFDAAFQLAAYVMRRVSEEGILADIRSLEVVLRGVGAGREAVTKALLGAEGRHLRGRVVRVSDATRLKFGGTRSPNPRRLG